MVLANFDKLITYVGQGSDSQWKKLFATILQKEHLINESSTKLKNKFCFQASINNFKNFKKELPHMAIYWFLSSVYILNMMNSLKTYFPDVSFQIVHECPRV